MTPQYEILAWCFAKNISHFFHSSQPLPYPIHLPREVSNS